MFTFSREFKSKTDEEILKEFPASLQCREDDLQDTPLIAAIDLERVSLVEKLLRNGFSSKVRTFIRSPIGAAISLTSEKGNLILEMLLEDFGPIEEEHPNSYCGELIEPMLHAAIRRDNTGAVELLIQHGASLDWKDEDFMSGFDLAREVGLDLSKMRLT